MSLVPIVAHHTPGPEAALRIRAERLAASLLRTQPQLSVAERFRDLVPDRLQDAPALQLDDLSEIPLLGRFYDVSFMEERARLRAGDGDLVATCTAPDPAFEAYCRERLGLGTVTWLHPWPVRNPLSVALACYTDREVRHELVRAARESRLRYVHPHLGGGRVWVLAALIRTSSRRPIQVIAPHPGLARRVNDKIWFSQVVDRLFGERFTPRTAYAWNLSTLARLVREFARDSRMIVVKVPDSAGGAGNLLLDSHDFRGRSLPELAGSLKDRVRTLTRGAPSRLLVGCWETAVLSAPSAQLWVPPPADGPPVVEGVYEQAMRGREGFFIGSRPARLPAGVTQEIVDRCWPLALLYQRLGYVGRCSYDMILVGKELERARLEFVECNGRWGGTSIPMTLMNRLFGDWASRPYATREFHLPGLEKVGFADLLDWLEPDLYDARTGAGRLILYNPGGLGRRAGIDVLALGATWNEAERALNEEVPERLRGLAASRAAGA